MFDKVPTPIRDQFWRIKHLIISWFARKGLAEYLQGLIQQQIDVLSVTVVLDVGANDGQYARMLRRLGYRGRIISFEPLPENIDRLEEQARLDPLWTVVPVALGDQETELAMNVMAQSEFSSFLNPNRFGATEFPDGMRVAKRQSVDVRRLDALLPELVPEAAAENIHLKLDTQGFDIRVLRGCESCIEQLCSLQLEVSFIGIYEGEQGGVDMLEMVRGLGFFLTGMFPVSRDGSLRVIEADCLFRRVPT